MFSPGLRQKKLRTRPKKRQKNGRRKPAERRVSAHPVLVHQKLEKSRVKFFKRQKKLKTDRASEKKYEQWLN